MKAKGVFVRITFSPRTSEDLHMFNAVAQVWGPLGYVNLRQRLCELCDHEGITLRYFESG